MERDQATKFINDLLRLMISRNGSDLFITADFPPAIKVDGKVTKVSPQPLTGAHTLALTRAMATLGPVNVGYQLPDYTAYEDMLNLHLARIATVPVRMMRLSSGPSTWVTSATARWIATCTSGDPVSPALVAKVLMTSALRSAVIDIVKCLRFGPGST